LSRIFYKRMIIKYIAVYAIEKTALPLPEIYPAPLKEPRGGCLEKMGIKNNVIGSNRPNRVEDNFGVKSVLRGKKVYRTPDLYDRSMPENVR